MNQKPARPSSTAPGKGTPWLIAIVGGVTVLIGISQCSSGTSPRTAAEVATSDPTIMTLNSTVAAQTPLPIEDLNPGSVKTGLADMRKSVAAEGLSGAMIYSQNCYDALSRTFSWRLIDVCGASDLTAVASVPDGEVAGLDKEIAYFQSEVAAARYLGAATGAGTTNDKADERLSIMQTKLPAPKATLQEQDESDNAASAAPTLENPFNVESTTDDADVVA